MDKLQNIDVRKIRGMEIANTIGNRSAKAVSIKRLNKLAYQVRSQTNQDKWYNVIDTYENGWTCECKDFENRFTHSHMQCKHIHAVQFSKLLRKKIYQDTILQLLQELQAKDLEKINPNAIELGQIVCPKCLSQAYQKFGIRHNKYGDMQCYVCKACNHRFVVNPAFENAKTSAKMTCILKAYHFARLVTIYYNSTGSASIVQTFVDGLQSSQI